jgi:hypothetical protein
VPAALPESRCGTHYIVFYKEITVASDDGDSDETDTRLFARATPVFAAVQVDGYAAPVIDALAR